MINKINAKTSLKSEEGLAFMAFGNVESYAALAILALSTGNYIFPNDVDPNVSKDILMIYYLIWKIDQNNNFNSIGPLRKI